jgi:hypothetical protein
MGIKELKKRFDIKHIVHKRDGNIYIGSPYVSELIKICPGGNITCSSIVTPGKHEIGKLYSTLISTDKKILLEIINTPDNFTGLKAVYRESESGKIVKEYCEEFGFPNSTTAGELMYDNVHFASRSAALQKAIRNNVADLRFSLRHLSQDCIGVIKKIKWVLLVLIKLLRQNVFNGH